MRSRHGETVRTIRFSYEPVEGLRSSARTTASASRSDEGADLRPCSLRSKFGIRSLPRSRGALRSPASRSMRPAPGRGSLRDTEPPRSLPGGRSEDQSRIGAGNGGRNRPGQRRECVREHGVEEPLRARIDTDVRLEVPEERSATSRSVLGEKRAKGRALEHRVGSIRLETVGEFVTSNPEPEDLLGLGAEDGDRALASTSRQPRLWGRSALRRAGSGPGAGTVSICQSFWVPVRVLARLGERNDPDRRWDPGDYTPDECGIRLLKR